MKTLYGWSCFDKKLVSAPNRNVLECDSCRWRVLSNSLSAYRKIQGEKGENGDLCFPGPNFIKELYPKEKDGKPFSCEALS